MPVRKIGVTSFSVTSNFSSIKTSSMHMCESTLETDYCYHLEFDNNVESYEAQPLRIQYKNQKGRKDYYTPDFKVKYTNNGIKKLGSEFLLAEIKYLDELKENAKVFENRFEAARRFCRDNGGTFEVFTEEFIRDIRLTNYKFLYRYLNPQRIPKLNIDFSSLSDRLETFNAVDWMNNIDGDTLLKGQALTNLWAMVAKGELTIDLEKLITNDSIIQKRKL